MKATKEQIETIKRVTLKTLDFYIDKYGIDRNEVIKEIKEDTLNLELRHLYSRGSMSIQFDDDNDNVLRTKDGKRLFEYDNKHSYYLGNLNEDNVNAVYNLIKKEL